MKHVLVSQGNQCDRPARGQWVEVADISVKVVTARRSTSKRVIVTSTHGHRYRLSAPAYGVSSDRGFDASAQLQDSWHAPTTGSDARGAAAF